VDGFVARFKSQITYCGDACRRLGRRRTARKANAEYRGSCEEVRLDHRDHQRAYRGRQSVRRVRDQGCTNLTSSASVIANDARENADVCGDSTRAPP
jgi:hypothetical protein